MKQHSIPNGYTIRLHGDAARTLEDGPSYRTVGVSPLDFPGLKPGLLISKDDPVKKGTPLFQDKKRPEIVFVSPVAGTVSEIVYGPRRSLQRVVITPGSADAVNHGSVSAGSISSMDRGALVEKLLAGGVWPLLRQRPFDRIADPGAEVSSIFVNGMDTAPLAPDQEFLLQDKKEALQAGLDAMKVLAGKAPVYFTVSGNGDAGFFKELKNVELHSFRGKHPAGLVSTHIEKLDPISQGKHVWYASASQVARIGEFLLTGEFPSERLLAVAGESLQRPAYIKTTAGISAEDLLRDRIPSEGVRIISGNVLSGRKIDGSEGPGFYDDLVTVIPEGGKRRFLGWLAPGFSRPTTTRLFASSFLPARKLPVDASLNGEERALVMTGTYKKYMSLDIHPDYLVKAILAEDLEMMEQLGILETAPEDFALCSYICPSKTEFTEIVRKGLDLFEAETT